MGAMLVVMTDIDRENPLEVASVHDQDPVETLATHCADPPLDEGVRAWRAHEPPLGVLWVYWAHAEVLESRLMDAGLEPGADPLAAAIDGGLVPAGDVPYLRWLDSLRVPQPGPAEHKAQG